MALTAALSAGGVVAGKKAIEQVVTDLYDGAKGAVKNKIKTWKNKRTLDTLFKRISNVRNVKTIWQIDREVDLLDFYHPTKITVENERRSVTTISDFGYDGNILIEGIVGQGKSIFLRFLCSQEIYRAKRIPVFLELRRIAKGDNLVETLLERMRILGFEVGKREFAYLARTGKLVVLLDAFDEVPEEAQAHLVTQIESLAEKYDDLQILITSRPDNQIVHSPHVRVFRLASIENEEIDSVIAKLTEGTDIGARLIAALKHNPGQVKGVLTTPLMITLLVITYRAYETLPSRLSEFYNELFTILICRHDKTKPGFVRVKQCGLSDTYIREIFDGLCFLMRRDHVSQVTESQILEYAKNAITLSARTCDEAAFIDDIRQITNLLLREANKYYFIHKSVQEFHCASYVSNLKDDQQTARFYARVRGKWWAWREELNFLADIDEFKFAKFFLVKDTDAFFSRYVGRVPKTWKRTPRSVMLRLLSDFTVIFGCREGKVVRWQCVVRTDYERLPWCLFKAPTGHMGLLGTIHNAIDQSALALGLTTPQVKKLNPKKHWQALMWFPRSQVTYAIRADNAYVYDGLRQEECTEAVHSFIRVLVMKRRAAENLIASYDKRTELMDF